MTEPATSGQWWFLDDAEWQGWLNAFPAYSLVVAKDFSRWRRKVEGAARQPFPVSPLSERDKAIILDALTSHSDRLRSNAGTKSATTAVLASATAAATIGALFLHPLLPVAAVLGVLTGANAAWETGLGSNAGNAAVDDLLTKIAERLP